MQASRFAGLRRQIAYHEAGHAVATWALGFGDTLEYIEFFADHGNVTRVNLLHGIDPATMPAIDLEKRVKAEVHIPLAGPLTRRRVLPGAKWQTYWGAHEDIEQAEGIIRDCWPDDDGRMLRQKFIANTSQLLAVHWAVVDALARRLLEKGSTTKEQLAAFFGNLGDPG